MEGSISELKDKSRDETHCLLESSNSTGNMTSQIDFMFELARRLEVFVQYACGNIPELQGIG